MRKRIMQIIASSLAVTVGFLSGCASQHPATADSSTTDAVRCDKCRITWVKYPIRKGPHRYRMNREIIGFGSRQSHECPECRQGLESFFAAGTLGHTCGTCGGVMSRCEGHDF